MDYLIKIFSFLTTNYEMFFAALTSILLALGAILETINALLGGKESALSKVAKFLAKAGETVKKLSDFLKPKK